MLCLPLLALGCSVSSSPTGSPRAAEVTAPEPAALVGPTDRAGIEAAKPDWIEEIVLARPDAEVASRLLDVEPAEVVVYLGTWCSDSRRELSRLWRVLDDLPGPPPFALRYVAVDRDMREPRELLAGVDLRYVPTFVVEREGRELGRVIEVAPSGIEGDLLDLLLGRTTGWITARDDMPASAAAGDPDG